MKINILFSSLTSPIYCFNSPTVQPCSALIGSAGPTSPLTRSITAIFNFIPTTHQKGRHSNRPHPPPLLYFLKVSFSLRVSRNISKE